MTDMGEMSPHYAGIGSRGAPPEILVVCHWIALAQRRRGRVLRTGHARGCDQAFEAGACTRAHVYLPWSSYEAEKKILARYSYLAPSRAAMSMALELHPAPENLSSASLRLLGRNCHVILGPELDEPVERVVCWTSDEERGGTAFSLRVAREHGVWIDNLYDDEARGRWVKECERQCDRATASLV